jgi:ribbon-helix-helix CopG family protein
VARRLTTVELEDEQLRELERLAAHQSAPVDELVRRAVDQYLAAQSKSWGARFDALVVSVQARLPDDLTPDDIEADITTARSEVRAARARRGAGR